VILLINVTTFSRRLLTWFKVSLGFAHGRAACG
jgi:hypothetical protein